MAIIAVLVSDMQNAIKNADKNIHDILLNLGFDNPSESVASYVWQHPWSFILLWVLVFAIGALISWGVEALWNRLTGGAERDVPRGNPLGIERIEIAKETPIERYSAIRIVVENRTAETFSNLLAQLAVAQPLLEKCFDDHAQNFSLPLTLTTKTRLDAFRNKGEPLPHVRFQLGAYERKHIEVLWLHTDGALEGHTTYEGGEACYVMFWPNQIFEIEVSGAPKPLRARLLVWKTNEETGAWDARLMPEGEVLDTTVVITS